MDEANSNKVLVHIYYFCRLFFKDWQYRKWSKVGKLGMQTLHEFAPTTRISEFLKSKSIFCATKKKAESS